MEDKIQTIKQEAFEVERQRIERELEPRAKELAEQFLREEETLAKQQMQAVEVERNREVNALALRVKEAQGKLNELRRQKVEARVKTEKEQAPEEVPESSPAPVTDSIWGSPESSLPTTAEPVVTAQEEAQPTVETEPPKEEQQIVEQSPADLKSVAAEPPKETILGKQTTIAPPPSEKRVERKKGIPKVVWYAVAAVILITAGYVAFQYKANLFPTSINLTVLPMKGSSPELEALGSSLAEEIADRLQYAKPLNVMRYSSSSQFARTSTDPSRAIFELGYTYILQGSLKNNGDNFIADMKLVDSIGTSTWTQSFEITSGKLYELPVLVTHSLAEVLALKPDDNAMKSLERQSTLNGEAYKKFLQGMSALHRQSKESVQNALQLFQQAGSQDSKFSSALSAAAEALLVTIEKGWDTSDETLQRAEQFSQAAVNADPTLPQAHVAKGKVSAYKKKYLSAMKDFDDALAMAPSYTDAQIGKANILIETGKYDDALDILNRATEISPRDPQILRSFGYVYQLKNEPTEAMRYHEASLLLAEDSTRYLIGPMADIALFPEFISSYNKRIADAFQRYLAQNPGDYVALYRFARLRSVSGNTPEAKKIFDELTKQLRTEYNTHPQDARVMVYLGLALTRSGKFSDATTLANKALETDKSNPEILYKAAQIFSVQKKPATIEMLHKALMRHFDLSEIANGDFYNFHDQPEFATAVQMPMQ